MSAGTSSGARPPLSVIITCFNSERDVADCIESLLWAEELFVVDSFSTDRTPEIARSYDKVRFAQRTYFGAASQKNWALDRVEHDWVLIFDVDERCTPELRREIEALLASGPEHEAYTIRRRAYFLGHRLRFCGWQRDDVVRLIRQGTGRYQNRRVHPKLLTRGQAPLLKHPMDHYMVREIDDHVKRVVKYSYWGAAQAWKDGRRSGFIDIFPRAIWRFIRAYVVQLGFLDGAHGLVFCVLQAIGTYLKWSTVWSWQVNAARGIRPQLPAFDEDETVWEGAHVGT